MNESVGSAIKKIKLQEEDNEAKLKEKRELEATIINLKKKIRDKILAKDKCITEQNKLIIATTSLRSQLQLEEIRKQALTMLINDLKKEYDGLRLKCDEEISNVWNMRSNFCDDIHKRSDQYDVRALLVKPHTKEAVLKPLKVNEDNIVLNNEEKLNSAKGRLQKAIEERDRLQTEPDIGEEFVRIKNALQYSLQSIAALKTK